MMRLAAGLLALVLTTSPAQAQRASYEELQTFSTVLNLIRLNHVDTVTYTPLVRAAIEGALGAVDPHSRYVRRDMEAALIAARTGELGTAGVELDGLRGTVTVLAVGSGSPAERAGVLPGDRIVAVQDSVVAGLAAHEVELLLAGQPRAERRVKLERGDPLSPVQVDVKLRLERYTWPNVSTPVLLNGGVAYVRLEGFHEHAAAQLARALDGLRKGGMRRLILDLRGNPGGLLSEAVEVAALFLPANTVVMQMRGRKTGATQVYRTQKGGSYRELPLLVLVDGSTASAAEALAGALQDHGRATVAGHRTFGKALVQAPFPLPAGDVLWLTIARVHTPSGRMIQRSYDGLTVQQYRAAAEALRRGGPEARITGGIEPEVWLDERPPLPSWWAELRQKGLDVEVAQRARLAEPAGTLEHWHAPLLDALRSALQAEYGSAPQLAPEQERAVVRQLTVTALAARSGTAEAQAFAVRSDPEVLRAVALLAGAAPSQ